MMRYFHIAYQIDVGQDRQRITSNGHMWFESGGHPSFDDIKRGIAKLNSRYNIVAVTLHNIHEFKTKEDYEAFTGEPVKYAESSGGTSAKPKISAEAARAKMYPKKEDFKEYTEVHDKLRENDDSAVGVLGYLMDEGDSQWKLLQLDWMIEHYESQSDYEKCAYIRDVKKRNFYVAPPIMQGILNDQMALSLGKENEQG